MRLVGWRGCGKGGESGILGVAAVRLVEVELVIRDLLIVRGDAGLRVLLPRGAAAVDQGQLGAASGVAVAVGRRCSAVHHRGGGGCGGALSAPGRDGIGRGGERSASSKGVAINSLLRKTLPLCTACNPTISGCA